MAAEERVRGLLRAADPHFARDEVGELVVGQHDDRAGAGDGELLGGDLLARVAEHLGVLEPDVRQQDDARVDHVRRVVAAAEPGLDRSDLRSARGEVGERGRGERLELRRVDRLGRGTDARDRLAKPAGSVSSRSCQPATCGEV